MVDLFKQGVEDIFGFAQSIGRLFLRIPILSKIEQKMISRATREGIEMGDMSVGLRSLDRIFTSFILTSFMLSCGSYYLLMVLTHIKWLSGAVAMWSVLVNSVYHRTMMISAEKTIRERRA